MVVVAAGRDERGLLAVALDQLEAEHAAVEGERAVEVGDLEVDVADAERPGSIGTLGGSERLWCGLSVHRLGLGG